MQPPANTDTSLIAELERLRGRVVELETEAAKCRRLKEALRCSEARLADTQRMARIGICVFNIKEDQITWSPDFCRLFDLDPGKFSATYEEFMQMVHPDDRECVDKEYRDSVRSKQPYEITHRLLMEDGTVRHVHKLCETIYDEAGNPIQSTGIIQDVTEQKNAQEALCRAHDELEQQVRVRTAELRQTLTKCCQTEAALRQSEAQFRSLVENIPGAVYRCKLDSDWTVIFVSEAMAEISGYPATDLMQEIRSFASIIHPDDRQMVEDIVAAAVERKQPYVIEYRIIHVDGDIRWIYEKGQACFNEKGETLWLDGAIFDVTERKLAENQLHDSEHRFREMAENINDVFWMTNITSEQIIYVSPSYELIWGRPCADLVANPRCWIEAVHPDDRNNVDAMLQQMMEGIPAEVEYRIIRPDGSIRWIRDRGSPICYGEKKEFCLSGMAEDITEWKEAEAERLAYAHRQRDTLIREVHHRIKNNLQGVIGLLGQQARQHPEIAEHLREALSQLESVAIVFGLQSQAPEGDIVLGTMVKAISDSIRSHVDISIELTESPLRHPLAKIDSSEAVALALTINELLMNATKHQAKRKQGSGIKINQIYHGDIVELSITNHGQLVPEFDFEHGRGLGTGLGLVRSMMPRSGIRLRISGSKDLVTAQLNLCHPLVQNLQDG